MSERIKNFSFKEDNKQKRSILASFIFLSISIRFTYKIDKFGDDGWDFTNIVSPKVWSIRRKETIPYIMHGVIDQVYLRERDIIIARDILQIYFKSQMFSQKT